jgi:hypothetical protein
MASSLTTSRRPNSLAGIGHKASAGIAAGGEFYDCKRFCAMFDKPYIARYERKAGKFSLVGTFKDEAAAGAGKSKRPSIPLRFDELTTSVAEERCAWCGVKNLVFCGGCSEFVCHAHVSKRDGGLFFRCRASCQCEGMTEGTIETFEASKRVAPPRLPGGRVVSLPEKGNAAALPAPAGQLRLKA